ncbi:MAG: hypothetical protein QOJ42_483 [Acidobacteriaceae bacterium]|nr:hypothetical protein [Acidobacteriaceae bacterium]
MCNRPSARVIGIRCRVCLGEAGPRRDDDPATVDYLREQAPYSQYNGYSLRRDRCSLDSTLQEGNRMTICSWRTQSPKRPQNFVRPHAKLRNSKARCATTSVLRNRHSALCQRLKFARSISRDDIRSVTQICPPDTPLYWPVLLADDSLFRDHRWSTDVRPTRDRPRQLLHTSQHSRASLTIA